MTYLICSNSKNNKQQVERIIEQCLWIAMKKYYNEKEINQKKKILHKNVVLIICSNDNDNEQKRHNIPELEEIDYVQQ